MSQWLSNCMLIIIPAESNRHYFAFIVYTYVTGRIQALCWVQSNVLLSIVVFPGIQLFGPSFNTLRPRQNARHFADDIFKCIFLNENVLISIKSSLKFVPKGPINNIPTLVQVMAWRRPGDKPLSELVMVRLPTHICVTRPQWVNNKLILPLGDDLDEWDKFS